jgi:flagellar biosynthesis/type III secretory pathway chaperone
MATIIPEEFANKTKEELFEDISALSRYVTKLRRDIEELQAQLTLKNGEIIKKRTDKNNIVDIDWQPPKEEK